VLAILCEEEDSGSRDGGERTEDKAKEAVGSGSIVHGEQALVISFPSSINSTLAGSGEGREELTTLIALSLLPLRLILAGR
jgi:hypothetical protein